MNHQFNHTQLPSFLTGRHLHQQQCAKASLRRRIRPLPQVSEEHPLPSQVHPSQVTLSDSLSVHVATATETEASTSSDTQTGASSDDYFASSSSEEDDHYSDDEQGYAASVSSENGCSSDGSSFHLSVRNPPSRLQFWCGEKVPSRRRTQSLCSSSCSDFDSFSSTSSTDDYNFSYQRKRRGLSGGITSFSSTEGSTCASSTDSLSSSGLSGISGISGLSGMSSFTYGSSILGSKRLVGQKRNRSVSSSSRKRSRKTPTAVGKPPVAVSIPRQEEQLKEESKAVCNKIYVQGQLKALSQAKSNAMAQAQSKAFAQAKCSVQPKNQNSNLFKALAQAQGKAQSQAQSQALSKVSEAKAAARLAFKGNSLQKLQAHLASKSGPQKLQVQQKAAPLAKSTAALSSANLLERTFKNKIATGGQMAAAAAAAAFNSQAQKLPAHAVQKSRSRTIFHRSLCGSYSAVDVHIETPIYALGSDIMANCLSFLSPPDVHVVLTTPLSKTFKEYYTDPQDLWKILCYQPPFYANVHENHYKKYGGSDSGYSSSECFSTSSHTELKHLFGQYRMLYTSFIRCMQYLGKIRDDAITGKGKEEGKISNSNNPSTNIGAGAGHINLANGSNVPSSLTEFLASARRVVQGDAEQSVVSSDSMSSVSSLGDPIAQATQVDRGDETVSSLSGSESEGESNMIPKSIPGRKKVSYGHSKITERLLGPSKKDPKTGKVDPGHTDLPWSCAIYAVLNWMVAFADVLGIQVMCLKALPSLLEDEKQRTTGQLAGLTGIVIRAMVLFPDSDELHTAAFHTLVLLARPLGGKEGMLFHRAMMGNNNPSNVGIFDIPFKSGPGAAIGLQGNGATANMTNGTAVILDSMRRFAKNEVLQAMACWAMVNIALVPAQKAMLVRLGGIGVTANAMLMHPFSAEVQFRALFALINLVIPCEQSSTQGNRQDQSMIPPHDYGTEKEMLDEQVGQIANLVIVAMKNFCTHEAILNRACLVLHNLSLNRAYHTTLLWTPNCYQMLQWTMANYPHDRVIAQSAGGTLQRLQLTLRDSDDLRMRFAAHVRAQQQQQQQQQEAMMLQQQRQIQTVHTGVSIQQPPLQPIQ